MSIISATHASVRFHGDDLDPDNLSARLGAQPDSCARKGEFMRFSNPKRPKGIAARTGSWTFSVEPRKPGDLDGQIRELFGSLTSDLNVWRELAARYDPNLFVGLFMKEENEGIEVSADCLAMLAERGVRLDLDVYDPPGDAPDDCASGE